MTTGYFNQEVQGIWDEIYSPEYSPEGVRKIIREEIDLALRSPDISELLIDGTVPATKLRIASGDALPISAADGTLFVYTGSGFSWLFQYYRKTEYWHFLGGPPLHDENTSTGMTTTSTTFVDLSTVGPSTTAPFFGDYLVELHFHGSNNTAGGFGIMAVKVGDATTVDVHGIMGQSDSINHNWEITGTIKLADVAAKSLLKCQYRTSLGTMSVGTTVSGPIYMQTTPIRVRRA